MDLKKTALYGAHQALHAHLVPFAGWEMPLNYGSQLDEHQQVRTAAGLFDVSHMSIVDIAGDSAKSYLRHLLANDVGRLKQPGRALYTCMLNEQGGVLDDLICYYMAPNNYRLVVNAATTDSDLAWLKTQSVGQQVVITQREDLSLVAIQGPQAREKTHALLSAQTQDKLKNIPPFSGIMSEIGFIARTGYTGEAGYELMLPHEEAQHLWRALVESGVTPCGLAARDTLRLEAGLNLYGHDMDASTSPLLANLAWTVAFEPQQRDFIGRKALEQQRNNGVSQQLVGLVLLDKGVLRDGQAVKFTDEATGQITSGGFSPTLSCAIALARVPVGCDTMCQVSVRSKWLSARVIKPPFVKHGKATFQL